MKKKFFALIFLCLLMIVFMNSIYIVDETQQSIITQFGSPIGGVTTEAGIHLKIPFVQKVHYFEKRIIAWDGDPKQIPTADKRYIWLDIFARWKIIDPLKFYQTVQFEKLAYGRLDDVVSSTSRDVISSYTLIEIIRSSNRELTYSSDYQLDASTETPAITTGREKITEEIFLKSKKVMVDFGIELIDVKIKRINYVADVRERVYERMISERQKIAEKFRSLGNGKKAEIEGKKQKDLDEIESEAYRKAQEIIGKADATATEIYAKAYKRDPEFFQFLMTMESYKNTLNDNNTLIISTDSDFYKFLKKIEQFWLICLIFHK
eukprot:TRINITY_DN9777_c0_g2_i1.p1 TRINITY_DN9777_c0_g2~~TRINITY_DN9777_c0_g2_i1.p1  ORF type:complete len:321 (+),score=57.90 TRINITY_DN9777_c0_g2_i1:292-1254(+)